MKHMTQAEMLTVVNSGTISRSEIKAISHIKPKKEKTIPNGFSVKFEFNNIYVANKIDDEWSIQMQGGSDFLRELCPGRASSLAEAVSNIGLFDVEGSGSFAVDEIGGF